METSKSASKAEFNGFEVKKFLPRFPQCENDSLQTVDPISSNYGTNLIQVPLRLTLWPIVSCSIIRHKILIYHGCTD